MAERETRALGFVLETLGWAWIGLSILCAYLVFRADPPLPHAGIVFLAVLMQGAIVGFGAIVLGRIYAHPTSR